MKYTESVLRKLPRLVTVSQSSRTDIIAQFGVDPSRIDVVPVGVDRVVELERPLLGLVDAFDQVAELRRQAPRTDELEIVRPAVNLVSAADDPAVLDDQLRFPRHILGAAATHHVEVELRDDRITRDGWMIGEERRSEETELFAGMPDEEQRTLRLH